MYFFLWEAENTFQCCDDVALTKIIVSFFVFNEILIKLIMLHKYSHKIVTNFIQLLFLIFLQPIFISFEVNFIVSHKLAEEFTDFFKDSRVDRHDNYTV